MLAGPLFTLVSMIVFASAFTAQAGGPSAAPGLITTPPTASAPRRTPTAAATRTGAACTDAARVALAQVGQSICVSGTVSAVSTDKTASYIKFKNAQFQIISYDLTRNFSVLTGRCVKVTGTISKIGDRPAIIQSSKSVLTDCRDKPVAIPLHSGAASPTAPARLTPQATPAVTAPPGPTASSPAAAGDPGKIFIDHQTQFDVTFIVWGPSSQTFGAAAFNSNTVSLPAGDYGWTSILNGCKLRPANNLPVRAAYTIRISIRPREGNCEAELFLDVQ
jgi:hypothetical protein